MGDIRYSSGKVESGTFGTLDDAFLHAWHEVLPSRAVVFWMPEGEGKRVLAVRPIGGEPREVAFKFDAFEWWASVPEPLKGFIAEDPTRSFKAGDLAGLEDVPNRPSPSVVTSQSFAAWRDPYGDWEAHIDQDVAAFIDAQTGRTESD